jgi:aldose 1-epimerase
LHPFFHRRAGERIRFVSDHAWSNGANMLPLAPVRGAPFDYGRGRILDARLVDHDFSAWRGSARFEAPDGPTVSLIADPIFRVLRLFAPPGRDFFAVEPMTHETDALNRLDRVAPMSTLAPGERLEGRVWIGLEGRA